jgi:hypothetical protein
MYLYISLAAVSITGSGAEVNRVDTGTSSTITSGAEEAEKAIGVGSS